jgi:hypothetical protein
MDPAEQAARDFDRQDAAAAREDAILLQDLSRNPDFMPEVYLAESVARLAHWHQARQAQLATEFLKTCGVK